MQKTDNNPLPLNYINAPFKPADTLRRAPKDNFVRRERVTTPDRLPSAVEELNSKANRLAGKRFTLKRPLYVGKVTPPPKVETIVSPGKLQLILQGVYGGIIVLGGGSSSAASFFEDFNDGDHTLQGEYDIQSTGGEGSILISSDVLFYGLFAVQVYTPFTEGDLVARGANTGGYGYLEEADTVAAPTIFYFQDYIENVSDWHSDPVEDASGNITINQI
jgi:hypothetical protein